MILRTAFSTALLLASLSAAQAAPAAKPGTHTTTTSITGSKHDNSAPINISSDNFQGDMETKIGTYIGNVIAIQGDYKLRADKMNVHVVNGKASKIDGTGNILFNSGIETASGDTGVYDLDAHTITLDGKVVLTKEKDVMRGTHLVMNLDTNKAYLTAKGMPGGGRVQGLFIPPPKKDGGATPSQSQTNGKPPAPPAPH
jgi:lipopolysaccharide export system protein LptA